jgi:hypothetical protein
MSPFARTLAIAATLVAAAAGIASAQRGSRGTMGVPRVNTAPPPAPAPMPSSSGRGVMAVPAHPSPTAPRAGDLPRITTRQGSGYVRSYRYRPGYGSGATYSGGSSYGPGSGYGNGSTGYGSGIGFGNGGYGHRFESGTSRRWRPGYTTWGVGCGTACFRIGVGGRTSRFFGSFSIGYPFAIPIYVPYFYPTVVERYVEPAPEAYYEPESARAASKLIVIGAGTGGGGDALTVETAGDSVRLQWLGAGRPAREVKLFVADSAQRPLATRSASPSAPTATFEVATLSAPVAYAGVTVTFMDGVTSTTLVPYRGNPSR